MKKKKDITQIVNSPIFKRMLKLGVSYLGKKNKLVNLSFQALEKLTQGSSLKSVGGDFIHQVKLLARLVQFVATGKYRKIAPKTLVLIIGAIIYFVSPFDVVPDFIPMLGYADDVALLAWIFSSLGKEIADFEVFLKKYNATTLLEYNEV